MKYDEEAPSHRDYLLSSSGRQDNRTTEDGDSTNLSADTSLHIKGNQQHGASTYARTCNSPERLLKHHVWQVEHTAVTGSILR
jgi:hypothetical protein